MPAEMTEALEQFSRRVTREAITVWNSEAQKRIMDAAGNRRTIDDTRDSRGSLQGRRDSDLHEIAQSFTAPVWDSGEGAWTFSVTHAAAAFAEWGAQPHEIRAKHAQALAFEWPDAPEEIAEQYESTFPTVFFDSVEHPGVPAVGYLRYGREQARRYLADEGFDTDDFVLENEGGDDE